MISCTEFILSYNELFAFLDRKYGREEVDRLWGFLFKPTSKGIPLINFVRKDGVKGCVDYWTGTLTEEPSDVALEEEGLTWIRDHIDVDTAGCVSVIWDTKKYGGVMHKDENTVIKEFHSSEHEYFHPDFHSSMNMGIEYLEQQHGEDDIKEYLEIFTKNVYQPVLKKMKTEPFDALEQKICETYIAEKAEEALKLERKENCLTVKIAYCPAVKHLRNTEREVSRWFSMTTSVVMQTLAKAGDLSFEMLCYDEKSGSAEYRFSIS